MISLIFVKIYASEVTFIVLWIWYLGGNSPWYIIKGNAEVTESDEHLKYTKMSRHKETLQCFK